MITVRHRAELIPIKVAVTKSEFKKMKFENREIYFELSQGISIEQIHLKIRDEFNRLCDTLDNDVKSRTVLSNGPFKKGVLQESDVIYKFRFKEGCRLLHLLDYIRVIGVISSTLSSCFSCHLSFFEPTTEFAVFISLLAFL